jgi:hypothetical protein
MQSMSRCYKQVKSRDSQSVTQSGVAVAEAGYSSGT